MEGAGHKSFINTSQGTSQAQGGKAVEAGSQYSEEGNFSSESGVHKVKPCVKPTFLPSSDWRQETELRSSFVSLRGEHSVRPYEKERTHFLGGGRPETAGSVADEFQDIRQARSMRSPRYSKLSGAGVPALLPFGDGTNTASLREQGRGLAKAESLVESIKVLPTAALLKREFELQSECYVADRESFLVDEVPSDSVGLLSLDDLKVRLEEARSNSTFEKLSRILSAPKETMEEGSLVLECRKTTDYLRNHACLLKLLEEFNTYADPSSGYYFADRRHPILKTLKEVVVKEGGEEDTVFEMKFNIDGGDGLILSIKRCVPVIMKTPQPQLVPENPLDAQILKEWELGGTLISGEAKKEIKPKAIMPSTYQLEHETFNNPDLFSALKERVANSSCDVTILVKFRDHPPVDQEKTGRGDRLATSRKNPKDFYRSEIMKLNWGEEYPKFIEIQIPLMSVGLSH